MSQIYECLEIAQIQIIYRPQKVFLLILFILMYLIFRKCFQNIYI